MATSKTVKKPAKDDTSKAAVTTAVSKETETKTAKSKKVTATANSKVKETANTTPAATGDKYMNAEQLDFFRQQLLDWKRDLMTGVDKTIHHMQDEAANFADPNDRATQEEEFSLELRTRDRERKLMNKIDEALERIESGDYGFCEECGVEIGINRLKARPTAELCIDCKTLQEIKEKQMAD
jgi:DnaK suppressor protein